MTGPTEMDVDQQDQPSMQPSMAGIQEESGLGGQQAHAVTAAKSDSGAIPGPATDVAPTAKLAGDYTTAEGQAASLDTSKVCSASGGPQATALAPAQQTASESLRLQNEPPPKLQQLPQPRPGQQQVPEQQKHQQQPQQQVQQPQKPPQPRRQSRRRVEPTHVSDATPVTQQKQTAAAATRRRASSEALASVAAPAGGAAAAAAGRANSAPPPELGPDGRPAKLPRVPQVSEQRLLVDVAEAVGLDPGALTEEEEALLADVEAQQQGQPKIGRKQYLGVRNSLLALWRVNVRRHLGMEEARKAVALPYTRHAEVAWVYLHTYGYINFGTAAVVPPKPEHQETVVIIGAGLAGLAAAQQLRQLGYKVLVLEARLRPGGRVHTARMEAGGIAGLADLGGSILTGCDGNPLAVLALQAGVGLHHIAEDTPLYWAATGQPVDPDLDQLVYDRYNAVLNRCDALCQQLSPAAGELISVEAALDALWQEEREAVAAAAAGTSGAAAAGPQGSGTTGVGGAGVGHQDGGGNDPLGLVDQLYQWHVANVEFANASRAAELSLQHWAQDDDYELQGAHVFTAGGNGRLVQLLTRNLPIMYGTPVTEIRYGTGTGAADSSGAAAAAAGGAPAAGVAAGPSNPTTSSGGVTVVTESGMRVEAAAAVVTLPLGVLKANAVKFDPPLPAAKQDAINRLGFGCLNKVALLFPYAFWDTRVDTFATVVREKERRGAYYLFYCGAHTGGAAVLMALVAGSAAIALESSSDQQAVAEVMGVLHRVFDGKGGQQQQQQQGKEQQGAAGGRIPEPLQACVTRWGSDPWSRGSYSSMAVSCRGAAEYEAMAAPVAGRLFFAGEATIHKYPATMHGAFLSGLREAGRIHYLLARRRNGLPPREGEGRIPPAAAESSQQQQQQLPPPPPSPQAAAPSPGSSAMERVRRLQALGAGLRGLFARGEPDLEFGCFKVLFGPKEQTEEQEWALVQIDLGAIRSRNSKSGASPSSTTAATTPATTAATAVEDDADAHVADVDDEGAAVGPGDGAPEEEFHSPDAAGGSGGGASTSASVAVRPGSSSNSHRRRAVVHVPLPRPAVEALWCMRGGDDARLMALINKFGFKLPGSGAPPDWDPVAVMERLLRQISPEEGQQGEQQQQGGQGCGGPLPALLAPAVAKDGAQQGQDQEREGGQEDMEQ